MNQKQYEKAAYHFRIAEDREAYSEAYLELRDQWIGDNATLLLVGIIGLLVLLFVFLRRRKHREGQYVYSPYTCPPGQGVWADLRFMVFTCRHPIDAVLYIKSGQKVSTRGAIVTGVLGLLVYMADYVGRGFIFNNNDPRRAQYTVVLATVLLPVILWIVCNYMVATIHAGDGKFGAVFRSTIYAFSPYILITPLIILLSQVLTGDEQFLLSLLQDVVAIWVVVMLFLFVKKVQDFTFGETVKNIVITLFLIIVILIAAALVYSLWNSISEYVVSVYREVFYRGLGK